MSHTLVCRDCAHRLGLEPPSAPEMLEGFCPQCGSTWYIKAEPIASFAEFPGEIRSTDRAA